MFSFKFFLVVIKKNYNMEAWEAIMSDKEARKATHKKKLEEITTILKQLALVSRIE